MQKVQLGSRLRHRAYGSGASIDARYLPYLLADADEAGIDTDQLMRRTGIDPKVVKEPFARIPRACFEAFLVALTRATRDEFWLYCSRKVKPGTFRMMCRLLVHCRTLEEAIVIASRFYRLVVDDFVVRLRVDKDYASITVIDRIDNPAKRPQLHGTILLFTYGLMSWASAKKLPLIGVYNAFGDNRFKTELERGYGAPVYFNQPTSELRFSKHILALPVLRDETQIAPFLSSVPGALMFPISDGRNFTDCVKGILRRRLKEPPSFEEVASILAVSPQTLRRRLSAEGGAGFQTLKDDVRRDYALKSLTGTSLTIEEIALALGFSEVSTFYRAFRRWTEQTPGLYREVERTNAAGNPAIPRQFSVSDAL